MKKYVKPDVYYENFELSHSVASCRVDNYNTKSAGHHSNGNTCSFDYEGYNIFNNTDVCNYAAAEIFCEQTGSDVHNFFAS